jgi:hypothetical protein
MMRFFNSILTKPKAAHVLLDMNDDNRSIE